MSDLGTTATEAAAGPLPDELTASPTAVEPDEIPRGQWPVTANRIELGGLLAKQTTPELTAYYWEAIRALRESDALIRRSIAGHALRELVNGLPHHLDVPVPGGLREFFIWLSNAWRPLAARQVATATEEVWIGRTIEPRLGAFLSDLDGRIERYAATQRVRRDLHQNALTHLDPRLAQTPESVQNAVVKTWMDLQDVFQSATHSGNPDLVKARAVTVVHRLGSFGLGGLASLLRSAEPEA
jgi:hypothetical protein